MAATASRWAALEERQRAVLVGVRQVEVLGRVAALEAALAGEGWRGPAEAEAGAGPPERDGSWGAAQDGIWRELVEDKGVTNFRFVRAPADYYERPLEYRMGIVGAASIHHLCKSMVMVNTKAPADLVDCADPTYSKYYSEWRARGGDAGGGAGLTDPRTTALGTVVVSPPPPPGPGGVSGLPRAGPPRGGDRTSG